MQTEVAIMGAGPAGSIAAHRLAATGDFSAGGAGLLRRRAARFLQRALHAPRLLNRIFRKLRRDEEMALRPTVLLRLLT